jgi:hypothetical protein
LICFPSGGIGIAGTESRIGILAAYDQPVYEVPAAKKLKWQSLQNLVKKEFDSCKEDCGTDNACLERCDEVYKFRLDREYKQFMSELNCLCVWLLYKNIHRPDKISATEISLGRQSTLRSQREITSKILFHNI